MIAALSVDVGNIIFGAESATGVKVWNKSDLQEQGQYWYDLEHKLLYLYADENPAVRYGRIECALREHIIDQSNTSYVIYENLALKYGAAHGIGGGSTHHIIVRNCEISYIGGGDQYQDGRTVRFGNGVEFWGNAHDNLVENCQLWEIYDAALTNQNNGPHVRQHNIVYRNNVIWNCEYSFEYWNRPTSSTTDSIYFINNTAVNAGWGWGHTQRPDPSGRHLCFYDSSAPAHGIVIRNNIFYEAKDNAFYAPGWELGVIMVALDMDHNLWYQAEGIMINVAKRHWTQGEFPAYQALCNKEFHSLVTEPRFVDALQNNYRLRPDSPAVNAGGYVSIGADTSDTPVQQGTGPNMGAY